MRVLRLAPLCAALAAAALSSCGEGGCSAPPEKQESSGGGGGGGGKSSGGGGGGGDIIIQEKKSKNVPKPYQRAPGEPETSAPQQAAAPSAAAPRTQPPKTSGVKGLPVMRVTRRKVDGVAERVEVKCRVLASSADGECSSAANYAEIKEKCCPGGTVERCKVDMRGVLLVGTGCEEKK